MFKLPYPSAVELSNAAVEFAAPDPSDVPSHTSSGCASSAENTFPSIAKTIPRYMSLSKHSHTKSWLSHVTAHYLSRKCIIAMEYVPDDVNADDHHCYFGQRIVFHNAPSDVEW